MQNTKKIELIIQKVSERTKSTKTNFEIIYFCRDIICNQFHNILRLFDVLPNFPFTTSEMMGDYYL